MALPLISAPLNIAGIAGALAIASTVAALVTIAPFGGTGAYLSMLLALPVLVLALANWRWFTAQDGSFPAVFALAYLIYATLLILPGRPEGSVVYIFDLLPLVLAIALYAGLSRVEKGRLLSVFGHAGLVGAALALAIGLYQVAGLGLHRADGFGNSAINYANISLLLGFLALAPLFSSRSWRWYFASGPIFGIVAAVLSGSRSVIPVGLVLIVVLGFHLIVWSIQKRDVKRWRLPLLISILATVAVFAAAAVWLAPQTDRITAMFGQAVSLVRGEGTGDHSMAIRFDYYQGALKAFFQAPFTGYGWHEAAYAAAPYMNVFDPRESSAGGIRHVHNDILQFGVSLGIGGVLVYLLILVAPSSRGWEALRER